MPASQLPHVEANLRGIARRVPGLPLTEILICRVALIVGRDLNARLDLMLRPAGLSEPEFRVLMALFAHEGAACPTDLCGALAQSPANLTRIGDALVRRGLVRRKLDPADRRRTQLVLRPQGERLIEKLIPSMFAGVGSTFDGFSAAEKKRLLAGLKKLLGGIDQLSRNGAGEDARVA